jgi:ABC-type branched-subunit amino acid transport system substrate-binding protein
VIVVIALSSTACSGSSKGAGGTTGTTAPSKPCPGTPIKIGSIAALTSPLGSAGGERLKTGVKVAVDAVNRTCSLGRPLEVNICDDKSDANANLACGRKLGSDGTLAILGSSGTFDDGVTASKLPAVFVNGTSPFELTNKNAYSSINGLALGISGTSAIKARGRKSSTLVLPDTPTLQFAGALIVKLAKLLDVKVDTIYFPQDTTDYAPVAAQVSEANDDAVGMLPLNPVAEVNALAQEGITPENHDLVVPGGVITPEILKQLGDAANGILVCSEVMPPTETANKGIQEFRADMQADGQNPDDPKVDVTDVTAWSNVKKLEGALLAAGPDVIKSLDTKKLVDAVVNHPVDRPEAAPYDFRKHAIPEIPDLAGFRVFTRKVAVLQIQDGKYKSLSDGFIDILKPPNLPTS